jgi:DNA-binding transcriptional LysR family regulator
VQVNALRARSVTTERTIAATSVDNILSFVAAGLGYSIVPWLGNAGPRVPGVLSQRITSAQTRLPILAAWRKRDAVHPLIAAMLDALESAEEGPVRSK